MKNKTQKAFTLLELVFVIVIIGILSAIAVPKFQETSVAAHTSKASAVLASVRAALSTERQKRILRGDTSNIGDLGNVFTVFDATTSEVLSYPLTACAGGEIGCWTRTDATHYVYKFADSGDARFVLFNNKLVSDSDASDCAKLEN